MYTAELFADRAGSLCSVFELARECLRFAIGCDERIDVASASVDPIHADPALVAAIVEQFRAGQSLPDPGAIRAVVDAVVVSSSPGKAAFIAAQLLTHQVDGFRASIAHFRDEQLLVVGDAFPLYINASAYLYGPSGLTMRPTPLRHPNDASRVEGLALWGTSSADISPQVVVNTSAANKFDAQVVDDPGLGGLKIALATTNRTLAELSQSCSFENDPHVFSNISFNPPDLQEIMHAAKEAGAQILMFPELFADEGTIAELHEHAANSSFGPEILIGGSYHHTDADGNLRNTLSISFPRSMNLPDLYHDKVGAFAVAIGQPPVSYLEDIVRGSSIRLFLGSVCSSVVLICADYLDDDVQFALSRLAPTLILVSSMSPKVVDFINYAARLASATQSTTVMVNNPEIWEFDTASAPNRSDPRCGLWIAPTSTNGHQAANVDAPAITVAKTPTGIVDGWAREVTRW